MDVDAGALLLQQIATDVTAMRGEVTKAMTRLEVFDTWRTQIVADVSDHETRLRLLERFRYTLAGMAVIGGVAAGLIGDLIGRALH